MWISRKQLLKGKTCQWDALQSGAITVVTLRNWQACLKSHFSVPQFMSHDHNFVIMELVHQRNMDWNSPKSHIILFGANFFWRGLWLTAVIILAWTPKICLECLLWCNQLQTRSSHHRNYRQRTVSYLSRNKLFSFCFNIQSFYK